MTSNLFQSFADLATASPQKKAVMAKSDNVYRALTYDEIYKKSVQLGELFISLGIHPDDKVSIILENHPKYAVVFFAVMYSQATAVLLDIQFSPQQVKNLTMHSDSKVLIVSGKNYAAIKNCVSDEVEVINIDA